ncbi:MAG: hypothetical protein ABIF08_01410 [Nanoarchaeota archaeon]
MSEENTDSEKWTFQPKEAATEPVKKSKSDNKIFKYAIIAVVFLVVGFLASSMTGMTGQFVGAEKISSEQVREKTEAYITDNFLAAGSELIINNVTEENGLYLISMSIDGSEFVSYASIDGKLLLPSGLDMDTPIKTQDTEPTPQDIPKTETPLVELFVMSFCPYGLQAENIMQSVVDLLGDKVDIIPQYILSLDGDGVRSLHGQYEWEEDGRQLCIMEEYNVAKLWEYLEVFNSECNSGNLNTCWKERAEEIGIDVSVIEQCFEERVTELLRAQATLSDAKGVTGSPTLLINGVKYTGARDSESYKEAICSAFIDLPKECSEIISTGDSNTPSGNC